MKRDRNKRPKFARGLWTTAALLLGIGLATLSSVLFIPEPWWSNIFANAAVVILLLIPGELILTGLRREIVKVEEAASGLVAVTERASETAELALKSSKLTARKLEDIRAILVDRQRHELASEQEFYTTLATDLRLENVIRVLKKATDDGLITAAGVRSPVWWTDLHFRYVIGSDDELIVRVETDDGTALAVETWTEADAPADFFQRLVLAVRRAGGDLGTGLNDPTESLERLSEMLVKVTALRSQEPLGFRNSLRHIIEHDNGWYFTEHVIVSPDHSGYCITVDALDDPMWEGHLDMKGWPDGVIAVQFARRMYGITMRGGAST